MDGPPQRPPLRFRVPALILGALAVACLLVPASALVSTASAQAGFIVNGDFEDGLNGWTTTANATLSIDASTGGVVGANAAKVTAEPGGVLQLRSAWWLSPGVTPGAAYGLEAWVLDDDPSVRISLQLEFLDEAGTRIDYLHSPPVMLAGDLDTFRRLLVSDVAPPRAAYARAVIEASVDAAGTSFAVDAVTLAQVGAAPVATPTQQSPPSPTPSPVVTPRSTATPLVTPTPTRTPVARPIAPTLWNTAFDDGTDGWVATRGSVEVAPGLGGNALVLRATSGSTAWVEQAVTVAPGSWYAASATLAPVEGVRAAWVRIAWYASDDASGAQMSTDDSEAISVAGLAIVVAPGASVSTGAVQAPSTARSARVRILLQPSTDSGAALAISEVAFEASQKPPPAPTPTPTPTATVVPTTAPSSTPAAAATSNGSSSPPPHAPAPLGSAVTADLEGQAWLRITEVMPDPIQPGRDADYEWVELTNLGEHAVDIAGTALRDPQASTALPSLVVAPGASVVIAAALAEVDSDARIEGAIGNGLGNEGDRLELLDASGRVVDAFEYGSGDLAVAPGESVQRWFDRSGQLEGTAVRPPSPGVHEPVAPSESAGVSGDAGDEASVAATEETETSESERSSEGPDSMAWMLLIAVGGGALGGVAAQRIGRS